MSYLKNKTLYPPQIKTSPSPKLNKIVVIPCYDEPDALQSLRSLKNCTPPTGHTEVILTVNQSSRTPESIKAQNLSTYEHAVDWATANSTLALQFFVLYLNDLPPKHAGVGLARKVGMDEAAFRLEEVGQAQGIIICYDADSSCDPNYLVEIERHFDRHPKTQAASIHYEHPTQGTDFPASVYTSIIDYELHLRYYINALRFAGHPHSFQTIGSSMAVRCDAYQQQGGMNRRKAGEDFYFLHKFIPLGQFTEIKTTKVIPSPRPSHRVPFGTGKAVQDRLNAYEVGCTTYAMLTFSALRDFLATVPELYPILESGDPVELESALVARYDSQVIQGYFEGRDLLSQCQSIYKNTANQEAFVKRFYRWFDAFQALKYVHYSRDLKYPDEPVGVAALKLLQALEYTVDPSVSNLELLEMFRKMDISN